MLHRDPDPISHFTGEPPTIEPDRQLFADKAGQIDIGIHNGVYSVCVMANSFAPACREFEIKADSVNMTIALGISKIERLQGF